MMHFPQWVEGSGINSITAIISYIVNKNAKNNIYFGVYLYNIINSLT